MIRIANCWDDPQIMMLVQEFEGQPVRYYNFSAQTFLQDRHQASRFRSERLVRAIFNRLNAPEAGRQFRERNAINPQEVSQ